MWYVSRVCCSSKGLIRRSSKYIGRSSQSVSKRDSSGVRLASDPRNLSVKSQTGPLLDTEMSIVDSPGVCMLDNGSSHKSVGSFAMRTAYGLAMKVMTPSVRRVIKNKDAARANFVSICLGQKYVSLTSCAIKEIHSSVQDRLYCKSSGT